MNAPQLGIPLRPKSNKPEYSLPWLQPGDPFPDVETAWPANSEASGLLAAGSDLSVQSLVAAYSHGIFPWYSQGQPILWWSTDPRMVLDTPNFRLHRSLKKTLKTFQSQPSCEIRIDHSFDRVIHHCSHISRSGQEGTWIVPEMVEAYCALHRAGIAHSVETWVDNQLVGGLYCVAIGSAVFGESMFALKTDASKIALAALVAFSRQHGIQRIDCQQNTRHLASLGAAEISRREFVQQLQSAIHGPSPAWQFDALYWTQLLTS